MRSWLFRDRIFHGGRPSSSSERHSLGKYKRGSFEAMPFLEEYQRRNCVAEPPAVVISTCLDYTQILQVFGGGFALPFYSDGIAPIPTRLLTEDFLSALLLGRHDSRFSFRIHITYLRFCSVIDINNSIKKSIINSILCCKKITKI